MQNLISLFAKTFLFNYFLDMFTLHSLLLIKKSYPLIILLSTNLNKIFFEVTC